MMRRGVVIRLCTAALFFLTGCIPGRVALHSEKVLPPDDYTPLEKASFYYFEGIKKEKIHRDTASAADYFRKALDNNPLHSPSLYELADLESRKGDFSRALDYSEKAAGLDSTNIWYAAQLGRMLIVNEKYDSALVVYGRLSALDPHNPDNYRYVAALHEQKGMPFTAISVLDSAEVKFGMIEELAAYKRQLLINSGLTDKAIGETLVMIDNFPYNEENYTILGELYGATGKDSLALDAFSKALAIDSTSVDAFSSMADFYRRRGNDAGLVRSLYGMFASDNISLADKLDMLSELTDNTKFYRDNYFGVGALVSELGMKYPDDFRVNEVYATHLIRGGELDLALKLYKQSLEESVRMSVLSAIIDIETYKEHPDSVSHYSQMAIALSPKSPDAYMRYGYALVSMKRYGDAEKNMRSALKHTENDSVKSAIYSSIGDVRHLADSSRTRRYYPLYEKAIKLNPRNIHALNNYSYYLSLEEKNLDKALVMIERVMGIEGNNPTYIDTYGWVLYKMGRLEDAKRVMRQAVSYDKTASPELLLHYGDVLYGLGENFLASVYWKKALEKGYDRGEIEQRLKKIEEK